MVVGAIEEQNKKITKLQKKLMLKAGKGNVLWFWLYCLGC